MIVSGAYLPLDIPDSPEKEARKKTRYVVEVNLPNRNFEKITDKDLHVLGWTRIANKLLLKEQGWWKDFPTVAFEKSGHAWKETDVSAGDSLVPLHVSLEEDLNHPPKIFVSDLKRERKAQLLDLNPQFQELAFGKEESVTWKPPTDIRSPGEFISLPITSPAVATRW